MPKGLSPTQRTLRYLRQMGWHADIVERWLPRAGPYGKRVDAFHFIDILAIGENSIIAVQSCGSNFSEHDKKILASDYAKEWLRAGGRILLIGWRKCVYKRGSSWKVWKPRVKEYKLEDFQ